MLAAPYREAEPMNITLSINGKAHAVEVEPETPLLWVLRDNLGFTGTKFGCGIAQCGACMVHVDGQPAKSCTVPASAAVGKRITTIEGLGQNGKLHPVQAAWIEMGVPQCGYCQSGQIMAAAALLARRPNPSDAEIDAAMAGNLCRCGTYLRIKQGIRKAARSMQDAEG
jgi:isoquinoline 1-oxidoreductase alpha subunit